MANSMHPKVQTEGAKIYDARSFFVWKRTVVTEAAVQEDALGNLWCPATRQGPMRTWSRPKSKQKTIGDAENEI
jgi:hypothetical protein